MEKRLHVDAAALEEVEDARRTLDESRGLGGALIKRFRYRVIYADLPGILRVIAFAHERRRTLYWRSRLKTRPE